MCTFTVIYRSIMRYYLCIGNISKHGNHMLELLFLKKNSLEIVYFNILCIVFYLTVTQKQSKL